MGENGRPCVGIDEFVEGLKAIPGFPHGKVWEYVQQHSVDGRTLEPYLFFSPASYTRNLIYKNEDFELIAVGWEIGQASRIHNHRGQMCWMLAPMGKLFTQNYRVENCNPEERTCDLQPTGSYLITPAAPAQVDPEEPVHVVENREEYGERAVSLHIYSKPIPSCEVYHPATAGRPAQSGEADKGTYCDVELYYTSEYGKLNQGETTARHQSLG